MRNVILLGLLVTLWPLDGWAISPFSQSFDPAHAEEILAGLGNRPRLQTDQWLQIIGDKKVNEYRVEQGDTLWGIAKKVFHDPFLWRKLWQVNGFLTNPHELSAGTLLSYYRDGADRDLASTDEPPVLRIPIIKLVPSGAGLSDLDKDSFVNKQIKNKFQPHLFVLAPEEKIYGDITGAYIHGEVIPMLHSLYVEPADDNVPLEVGKKYSVVHIERTLRDRTQASAPIIGTVVRLVGEIQVDEAGEHLFKMRINNEVSPIRRGDKVIEFQDPVQWTIKIDPPNDLQTRIVMGEDADAHYFSQGQLILLNKGASDGVKKGFVFRVWRETDPETLKEDGVEPESLADVQIIYSSPLSSVGYILRNYEPLQVGDTLIPRQAFSDPKIENVHPREIVDIY